MAKIHTNATDFVTTLLRSIDPDYDFNEMWQAYDKQGFSQTRFVWDLYYAALRRIKATTEFTDLFVGRDDLVSWHDTTLFVFSGNVNDTHITTAMKTVAKNLGVRFNKGV